MGRLVIVSGEWRWRWRRDVVIVVIENVVDRKC